MIPRFADFFIESGFARCFADKGCMSDYFKGTAVLKRQRLTWRTWKPKCLRQSPVP